jgi:hypothetical protein
MFRLGTLVALILAGGQLLAGPFDEKAGKEFIAALGDPKDAVQKGNVSDKLERPEVIREVFRIQDFTADATVRKQAEACISLWLEAKPVLKAGRLEQLAKDRQVSRLLATLLEHKHRLTPWCADSLSNDGRKPSKPIPADADLQPADLLGQFIGIDLVNELPAAKERQKAFKLPMELRDQMPFRHNRPVGWITSEVADPKSLSFFAPFSTRPKGTDPDPDPYGRERDPHVGYYSCFEKQGEDGQFNSGPVMVFGRGPNRNPVRMSGPMLLCSEGDLEIGRAVFSDVVLWVNGDLVFGPDAPASVDSAVIICTGTVRYTSSKRSVMFSDLVLVTGQPFDVSAKGRFEHRRNVEIMEGEKKLFEKFRPSSAADYGCPAADEETHVVVKEVKEKSAAAKAGMKPEDLVLRVNGHEVKSALQFGRELCRAEMGKGKAVVMVERGKETHYLHVDLASK